ncbi:hypothetical protein NMY22_g5720 [Coprinellus aureogranulatus]|nr:hypothetical protein NMY22_g5720 [Coprinellus aureogranulatus]
MSSWRFSFSSQRSRRSTQNEASSPESAHGGSSNPPPRYSNVSLEHTPQIYRPQSSEISTQDNAPWRSVTSLGSQLSTPTYFTDDPDSRSISASTITLTNPPRYSTLTDRIPSAEPPYGPNGMSNPEHTFSIKRGLKSKPWASLRLYDAPSIATRVPRKGRYPHLSNMDSMVGSAELYLSAPQTIRSIELVLKGGIVTPSFSQGGSVTFLDHTYVLWDRKFGDPMRLAHGDSAPTDEYNGRLSGNWAFPFCIPFPNEVDLATMHALYANGSERPIRFLPVLLGNGSTLSPFNLEDYTTPVGSPADVAPFDIGSPYVPVEKGCPVVSPAITSSQPSTQGFASIPLASSGTAAPSTPSLEPYNFTQAENGLSGRSSEHSPKSYVSSPSKQRPVAHALRLNQGASSTMHDSERSTSTSGYAPPPTFSERGVVASVEYELTLVINHGRFSSKARVSTKVIYAPVSFPLSMTPGRHMAYQRKETPPGPELDPDGWKQLPEVSIKGTFLETREVTSRYKLFLAKPLSYSRGTVVPCCIAVSCDDVDALSILASPRMLRVRLRRSIRVLQNQVEVTEDSIGPYDIRSSIAGNFVPSKSGISSGALMRSAQSKKVKRASAGYAVEGFIDPFLGDAHVAEGLLGPYNECDTRDVGEGAIWCTPPNFAQDPKTRRLYGEIYLPRDLQPTCTFPLFMVEYLVQLLAPATNAFVPDVQRKPSSDKGKARAAGQPGKDEEDVGHVYASNPVVITTDKRDDELTPVAFLSPRHRSDGGGP